MVITPITPGTGTYLSCINVCTKLTSRTLFTFGLNIANQSLPSFFNSGGTLCGSRSSRKLPAPLLSGARVLSGAGGYGACEDDADDEGCGCGGSPGPTAVLVFGLAVDDGGGNSFGVSPGPI